MRMGSQNKTYKRSTQVTEHKSLCNDIKGRRSF